MAIESLVARIESITGRIESLTPSGVADREAIESITAQLDHLRAVLAIADARVTPPTAIAAVTEALDTAERAAVDAVAGTGSAPLGDVQAALFGAIERSTSIPTFERNADSMKKAAKRFRAAAREATADLEGRLSQIADRVAGMSGRAASVEASITAAAEEAESRITTELTPVEAKVAELQQALSAQETRISNLQTTQTDSYTKAEERRSQTFAEAIETLRSDAAKALAEDSAEAERIRGDYEKQLATQVDALDKQTRAAVARIAKFEQDAGRLVSSTGQKAITGGFLESANGHQRRATVLQVIGSLLIVAIVAFGFYVVIVLHESATSLDFLVGRVLVALPAVGLAIYLFREAGRHRDLAATQKSRYLDHQALGPYIELLPEEVKNQLRERMAERAFFQTPAEKQDDDELLKSTVGTIQDIAKSVAKR